MFKRLAALILLLLLSPNAFADIDYSALTPPVELRAIWLNSDAIPKTEQGIRELVRTYHKSNLNVLLPEVVARGYAAYPTKLLARDPRFAGAVDPLPSMISEAHKLGMEVHPWVWVFRAGYTKDRGGILTAHPDWAERGKWGEDLSPNGGLWISPAVPEARDFLASLYSELVQKYDVDGIHLDYIRYEVESPTPYGYCEASCEQFKREYGVHPSDVDRVSFSQIQWNRFRERQINTFVQRISVELRCIRPNLIISAAVGSDPTTARLNLMQNWQNWIENKWVDFVTPMAYTTNDGSFARLVTAQKTAVSNKAILAPGLGLHMQKNAPEQTVRQVGISRQFAANGQALFASSYYADPQESALIAGPYAQAAQTPFRDPCLQSQKLLDYSVSLKLAGKPEEEAYFAAAATSLAEYADFRQSKTPYVPPTEPPINLPEFVVPLPTWEITRTAGTITLDGNLDDTDWKTATRIELAYNNTGKQASVVTTAMATYDDANIYIAFDSAEATMDKLKASEVKRDGPTFYDDSVEAFIDPTGKRRDYYHLSTNTLGTRFDQKVLSPAWNGDWSSATKLGDNHWTTEIAITFKSLGVSTPVPGMTWAINLTRNRTTSGAVEYLTWAVPYGSFHSPDRFGTIIFK